MGKKKHKKKRKDKKQEDDGIQSASSLFTTRNYPVLSAYWGLSRFLEPHETPFLNMIQKAQTKPDPLTDKDVEVAALAADQIVRKHKK